MASKRKKQSVSYHKNREVKLRLNGFQVAALEAAAGALGLSKSALVGCLLPTSSEEIRALKNKLAKALTSGAPVID